ncbi:hypothetical protein [Winogradskyella tangerina]|uniref:hypothetical protein n=1 Tax=Winogradskyella tangerina TaxID=2023240 RepID=UPI000DBE15D9|nr:hypothetical protein [Winogradskyella tangerina]
METTKYLGSLENVNLFVIRKKTIKQLLDKEIIKIDERNYGFDFEDSESIKLFTHYKGLTYEISELLLNEIYLILNDYVERVSDSSLDFKDIVFNSNAFIEKKDKIGYYKAQFENFFPKSSLGFSIYKGHPGTGFPSWQEYAKFYIGDSTTLLSLYLNFNAKDDSPEWEIPISLRFMRFLLDYHKAKFIEYNDEFLEFLGKWIEFSETDHILESIKLKINELSNNNVKVNGHVDLRGVFRDKKKFDTIIKSLITRGIVNNKLEIISQVNCKDLRILSAFCFLLKKQNLVHCNDKNLINLASKTFSLELKPSTYSEACKTFKNYYPESIKEEEHLNLLRFI